MDEFNYLPYLNDDDQLLQAENQLFRGSFPTFSVDFDDYFGDTSLPSAEEAPCDPESRKTEPNDENTATPKATNEVDFSRSPIGGSFLTSLFTFLLICIRLYLQKEIC